MATNSRSRATSAGGSPLEAGSDWTWWDEILVRAPGFAADGVLGLASTELARSADTRSPEFRERFDQEDAKLAVELRRIVSTDRFRAAVAWQNRHALATALDHLGEVPRDGRRRAKERAREQLAARYVQRYSVKNDSIGFFGPIGWARWDGASAATTFRSRPLIEHCRAYFEWWAVEATAQALGNVESVLHWLAPRRAPFLRVDGSEVVLPGLAPVYVDALSAEVLRRADGMLAARDLAGGLVGEGLAVSAEDVYSALRKLAAKRWVVWRLEPQTVPEAMRSLRDTLAALPGTTTSLQTLDALESAKDEAARAHEDSRRVCTALDLLDESFTTLTGTAPTRNAGQTYGGRTVAYLDCRRGLHLSFGADLLAALAPLGLVLSSARWTTYEIARRLRSLLDDAYAGVDRRKGQPPDLASVWFAALPLLHGPGARSIVADVRAELVGRWKRILGYPPDVRRVELPAASLADLVRDAFAAPHSGWTGARYVNVDVMLGASDVAAIREGRFTVVLGEVHLAFHAFRHRCFVSMHPDPQRLLGRLDCDLPEPRLLPLLPGDLPPRITTRTYPELARESDYHVALLASGALQSRSQVLESAELPVVRSDGGSLEIVVPGAGRFDVLDAFSELLTNLVFDQFACVAMDQAYTPRISLDRVVLAREAWRVRPEDLGFARLTDRAARFAAARAWAGDLGMPRVAFVRSPLEVKPFYVDFASPVFVDILAAAVRRVAAVSSEALTFTEMLPSFDELWLVDSSGTRYTSELRLVGFDKRPISV